jgi:hypothetical protein
MKPPDWHCVVDIGKVGSSIVEEGSLASLVHAAQRFGLLHILVLAEHSNATSTAVTRIQPPI